jgi:hypothetical protein
VSNRFGMGMLTETPSAIPAKAGTQIHRSQAL